MKPIVDPRHGDVEDDASSTKTNSLLSMAGSLLGEISLAKLITSTSSIAPIPHGSTSRLVRTAGCERYARCPPSIPCKGRACECWTVRAAESARRWLTR